MNKPKLYPLAPENWPAKLEKVLNQLDPPLNIHNMMAHHPDLMKTWIPFRNHVVHGNSLSPRQRELVILRTAHNCDAEYEWAHHVERGLQAGLDMAEIQRVKLGPDTPGWSASESLLLSAADDCFQNSCICAEHLHEIDRHFSAQQQLDLVITIGMYITLALIIKTYDVPLEGN